MKKIRIEIEGIVPSKKNSYEIRFNQIFWRSIKGIVDKCLKMGYRQLFWIGPSKEVKDFENYASWIIFSECNKFEIKGDVEIKAIVECKRIKDTDNLLGCLGDALQKGIRDFNDRQIRKWTIERIKSNRDRIILEINYGDAKDSDNPM